MNAGVTALFDVTPRPEGGEGGAVISPDSRYRYDLWRVWDAGLPRVGWVMLNPSTADATRLDSTLRRVLAYSRAWGYGGFVVRNLFALRATDPHDLLTADDPVGPENDAWLRGLVDEVDRIVVGWGTGRYPRLGGRWECVAALLAPARPVCLATAKDGQPCHPLYQRADAAPVAWTGRVNSMTGSSSGMVGRTYLERGKSVTVLVRWGPGGGPRNVLIERSDGSRVVRPFRGLRRPEST